MGQITRWWNYFWQSFFVTEEKDELMGNILRAKDEWEYANRYFQEAIDPEIIDIAIFQLDAAERKYMYILEQVRVRDEKSKTEQNNNNKDEVN
ncbi:MAG: YaaL family protein [Clostridia bacterium]|jgi:hypothetical protein|nr:YaaL family protein [Clostridia bacterium]